MSKITRLIFVDGDDNHNKIYNMTDLGDGTWLAEWGRVGASMQSAKYDSSAWDKKYREKLKKGYRDVTENYVEPITSESSTNESSIDFAKGRLGSVVDFVKKLMGFANKSIQENYTVSAKQVTQKQVDNAQEAFNRIAMLVASEDNYAEINNSLLELYSIIPRKMKQVKLHLLSTDDDDMDAKFKEILKNEQDTLDVMAGQVLLNKDVADATAEGSDKSEEVDILTASGLEIVECTAEECKMLKDMMDYDRDKFHRAFRVVNKSTQSRFDGSVSAAQDKKKMLLWHGSRNENWWNIFQTGLLIRPSSAVYSGSMFGDGCYFASEFNKSLGYTSYSGSRWAGGTSKTAFLAVFDVHVGKQHVVHRHDSSCYDLSKEKLKRLGGYDSTHAKKGPSLYRDEFIVYDVKQCTIKYVVEIK